jgi:hypothetical protein
MVPRPLVRADNYALLRCAEIAVFRRFACTAVSADNPESPARGTSELKTRSASALLEQDEACFGQHPLLPGGQAAAGLPSRQVADYLNDLDQIS